MVFVAKKSRARRHSPEKPLAAEPRPSAAAGRKVRTRDPADVTAEPAPRKWCPLHETSLHDATACRHINNLWRSAGSALRSVQLWGHPLVVTSVASPATSHATIPAWSPSWDDPTTGEKTWRSLAWARCVPRQPRKGSLGSRGLPRCSRRPRKRIKGVPGECHDNLRPGCFASLPWCDRALS
jgi:hypothetical protein